MIIQSKFDIGQTVYVISGGEIYQKEIDTIMKYLDRPMQYQFPDYDIWYDESEIYATRAEAQKELDKGVIWG